MEFEEINYQQLARFMAGNCTPEEVEEINSWANADAKNKEKLKQFEQIWNISGENKNTTVLHDFFDANEQWGQLQDRIIIGEGSNKSQDQLNNKTYRSGRNFSNMHSLGHMIARVAAIFLLAGLVGAFFYNNWYTPVRQAQKPALREVSTANAQRVNLTLGDGTRVMLNAGSEMKFPNQFKRDIREVYLEGEAFFDVKSNPQRPFVIHSAGTKIQVLGTSFVVRSYDEENEVRVVVKEGRVSFGPEGGKSNSGALLTANELGRYHFDKREIETAKVHDIQLYFSWRKGYLKFDEKPMKDVAKALQRRYGIKVNFKDPNIKKKKLTAFLKSRSIKNVLNVIAMSLDLDYKLEQDEVTFLKNANTSLE